MTFYPKKFGEQRRSRTENETAMKNLFHNVKTNLHVKVLY